MSIKCFKRMVTSSGVKDSSGIDATETIPKEDVGVSFVEIGDLDNVDSSSSSDSDWLDENFPTDERSAEEITSNESLDRCRTVVLSLSDNLKVNLRFHSDAEVTVDVY